MPLNLKLCTSVKKYILSRSVVIGQFHSLHPANGLAEVWYSDVRQRDDVILAKDDVIGSVLQPGRRRVAYCKPQAYSAVFQ